MIFLPFGTSSDNPTGIYVILGTFEKFPHGIEVHNYFRESNWIPISWNFLHSSSRMRGDSNRKWECLKATGLLSDRCSRSRVSIEILKRGRKFRGPFNNTRRVQRATCTRAQAYIVAVSIVAAFSLAACIQRRVAQHNPAPLRGISNDFRVLFYIIAARR